VVGLPYDILLPDIPCLYANLRPGGFFKGKLFGFLIIGHYGVTTAPPRFHVRKSRKFEFA
jgi:hypothetical protein